MRQMELQSSFPCAPGSLPNLLPLQRFSLSSSVGPSSFKALLQVSRIADQTFNGVSMESSSSNVMLKWPGTRHCAEPQQQAPNFAGLIWAIILTRRRHMGGGGVLLFVYLLPEWYTYSVGTLGGHSLTMVGFLHHAPVYLLRNWPLLEPRACPRDSHLCLHTFLAIRTSLNSHQVFSVLSHLPSPIIN